MKRIVFTADIQAENHPVDGVQHEGMNSRLWSCVESIRQGAQKARGGILVINGDLFDNRKVIEIDVLTAIHEAVYRASLTLEHIYIVVGNHDQWLRDGRIHSTSIFSGIPRITVVADDMIVKLGSAEYADMVLCMHAFTTDLERIQRFITKCAYDKTLSLARKVLVLHTSVDGARIGKSVSTGGMSLGSLEPDSFDRVLLGHYHKPQALRQNVLYIGSPYQTDRSEAGEEKRFIAFSRKEGWHDIPVEGMPEYRVFTDAKKFKKWRESSREEGRPSFDVVDVLCDEESYEEVVANSGGIPLIRISVSHDVTSAFEISDSGEKALDELSIPSSVKAYLERNGRDHLVEASIARLK